MGLSALILRSVRKAAKKTLFSLLIAGGLVLSPQADAEAAAPVDAGPLDFQGGGGAELLSRGSFGRGSGVRVVQTRIFSKTLGRTVDLGFLSPDERWLPEDQIEARLDQALGRQAEALGLHVWEWASLVRCSCPKSQTVYIADLDSPAAFPSLLSPKLPAVAKAMKGPPEGIPAGLWTMALKNIAGMRPPEGLFWDRVYLGLLKSAGTPEEALEGAVLRIARKGSLAAPRMEYGGQLTPLKDLEELSHEKAVHFLAQHIRNWGETRSRRIPKGTAPEWLAADLFNASRIFRVPLSYLAILGQLHFDSGGPWPGALDVYTASRTAAAAISLSKRVWSEDQLPLCDLEEASRHFPLSARSPNIFLQKHADLIAAFRASHSPRTLFTA
jgi:hypothetical protein